MAEAEDVTKTKALTPANANPWYVLMTLYGEQDGEGIDEELHTKNRAAWNAWAVHAAPSKRDEGLRVIGDLPSSDEWHTRGAEIRTLFEAEYVRRNPGVPVIRCPEPQINEAIDLKSTEFLKPVCIAKFFVPRLLRLEDSVFKHRLDASIAFFRTSASCIDCQFGALVAFQRSTINGTLDFKRSTFEKGLNLQSLTCFDLSLTESKFGDALVSVDVKCSGIIDMTKVKPLGDSKWSLYGFQFSAKGASYFNEMTVSGDIDLRQAEFGWTFSATSLSVSGKFDLERVIFEKNAYFGNSSFDQSVSFFQTTFMERVYFDGVFFGASVPDTLTFQDCKFKEPVTFHGARFLNLYPYFGGTILHEKTTFTDHPGNWPQGPQNSPAQAKATCAAIRHNLGKQGLPEAEHFFFRREMGFAGQIGGWWQRLPYRAFGAVSDYGYSIARPAAWLFWVWFLPIFAFAASRVTGTPWADIFEALWAAALSFANLFPVFGFHRVWFDAGKLAALSPWLKALAGAQTVVSLPLLFFLGLGLRTRFRMR